MKSKPYDVADSEKDTFKLKNIGLKDDVLKNGENIIAENEIRWWEKDQFPKRWVIVLLCFSAFLLCNMDRVSCCHPWTK